MENRKKVRRIPTQVHNRELDRSVAHHMMKRAGMNRINKGNPSWFSENWRKYAGLEK